MIIATLTDPTAPAPNTANITVIALRVRPGHRSGQTTTLHCSRTPGLARLIHTLGEGRRMQFTAGNNSFPAIVTIGSAQHCTCPATGMRVACRTLILTRLPPSKDIEQ